MAIGTKERPERIASDVASKTVKGPGAKTGASGTDTEDEGKGKKSMKKKLIVGLVVLLAAGGVAKFTVLAPKAKPAAAGADAKPVAGPVIELPEMTLNLTGGQYLRMKVTLQTIKGSKPVVDTAPAAQAVIDEFSNRSSAELTGDVARTKAKAGLLAKLNKEFPKTFMDATYTEFLMTT